MARTVHENAAGTFDVVRPLSKGIGHLDHDAAASGIAKLGWNLLREDLSLPAAVLYQEKLAHNLAWMQRFADACGAKLAPHGKTTMAPKLFDRQMQAGAWGITLATAHQTRVAYQHRIRRVLMANQLVGKKNMETISRLLEDPSFEFFCLVDSPENADQLARFFKSRAQQLNVLIELGVQGGRTGVRDGEQLQTLIAVLSAEKQTLTLCGVEVYEGVAGDEFAIRAFLQNAMQIANQLMRQRVFARSPVILSGAGSAWYDVVAEVFCHAKFAAEVEVLLRPGCYLTHDCGIYRETQASIMQRSAIARGMPPGLKPALQLWAYVQSIPEKNLAIVGMGKRDAAFDSGLPIPAMRYRPGNENPLPAPDSWKLTRLMDQHAYMQIPENAGLRVGDMIGFDISHPCLTFDKWRYLSILDSSFNVIDIIETFF